MYFKLCKCFISCSSKTISQLDFYASLQHLSHSFMPLSFFCRLRDIMSVLQSATHSIFFITVEKETKLLENQRKITREGFFFIPMPCRLFVSITATTGICTKFVTHGILSFFIYLFVWQIKNITEYVMDSMVDQKYC